MATAPPSQAIEKGIQRMKNQTLLCSSILAALLSSQTLAQRENGVNSKLELGIITTTGNTEDESIKVKGRIELVRDAWDYAWSLDAFRSSRQNQLTAQVVISTVPASTCMRMLILRGARSRNFGL